MRSAARRGIRRALWLLCAILSVTLTPLRSAADGGSSKYIGLIHVGLDHEPSSLPLLRTTLASLGYEEGRNLRFDWRNQPDEATAEATAREFVQNGADLIVAFEDQSVRAAQAATQDVPIVFLHVQDPVAAGYVKSLSHPGGNTTGFVTFLNVITKEVQFLAAAVPGLRRILLLADPTDPVTSRELASVQKAATALSIETVVREIETQADADRVFAALQPAEVGAVMIVSPNLRQKFPTHLVELAAAKRLAMPVHRPSLLETGGLFSYAADHSRVGKPAAVYIDRILKGEKPSSLPVQVVSAISLVVSRKTAKALGLALPVTLLALADEVIE